ncbi:hypothetical protein BH11BAC1_BH11BAC1_11930 [soil metagenome]
MASVSHALLLQEGSFRIYFYAAYGYQQVVRTRNFQELIIHSQIYFFNMYNRMHPPPNFQSNGSLFILFNPAYLFTKKTEIQYRLIIKTETKKRFY